MRLNKLFYLGLLQLLLFINFAKAQEVVDSLTAGIDSTKLATFNTDSVKKYFKASDTLIAYQLNKIEAYTLSFNKINAQLRRGFDTRYIEIKLPEGDSTISIAKINLKGVKQHASLKILYTTKSLLEQQQELLSQWQEDLAGFNEDLNKIKGQINSAKKDDKLLIMPADSALFAEYIKKLKPLGEKIELADSNALLQLKKLGMLQNEVSSNYLAVTDLLDETVYQISSFSDLLLKNEFGFIWNHQFDPANQRNFNEVVSKSVAESETLLNFYSRSNWISRLIVILLAVLFYFWMRRNIKVIRRQSESPEVVFGKTHHIARHLFLSTIVISLLLIPFVYKSAPQAFTQSLWGFQIIAMGFLIRKKLNSTSGLQIFILLMLFYITGFSNLLIETTYTERWIQLFISSVSLALGLWMYLSKKENYFSDAGFFKPLLVLFIGMNFLGLILNILGRVTLAKVFNTGANYGMIEAINLLIFVEIIIDAIYLSTQASKKNSRLTAYFKFKGMENRMRKILGVFAGLLWFVIFAENIHVYDAIFGDAGAFLSKKIALGDINFTFGSICVFLLVIWVSTLLSQMVSFIFGEHDESAGKNKLGSTVLLIRLAIFTLGLLLAFAASGIPLDKIAIIIGALGVGIGFGLQTIVNNLVSGIIIAFEKPIQIGDLIEVAERTGIVKEVGIRSSILTTFDGSEVIIPNGDILSQHLINWTKNNANRRIHIDIGVAYGSDMNHVEEVINSILKNHPDIYQTPEPAILVQNFGDNSVDIKLLFWTDMNIWFGLRAEIFKEVYNKLNEAGISIPFPQRDLHLKTIDSSLETYFKADTKKPHLR